MTETRDAELRVNHSEVDPVKQRFGRWVVTRLPGLLVSGLAVLLAVLLNKSLPAIPVLTWTVILGIISANVPKMSTLTAGRLSPGLTFAGKRFMRAGIVLLGLKLSIVEILGLGWPAFALVAAVVCLSFAGIFMISKAFRLRGDIPLLLASGFSICGASAIGAMAAARRSKTEDTVLPIAMVTLCGTAAIGVLPLLMRPLSLSAVSFGQWVGLSVHDVGQVVATAQTAGTSALGAAVIIKLTRVLLLTPIVAGAVLFRKESWERGRTRLPAILPLFIIGFLLMIAVRSLGWASPETLEIAAHAQDILIGMALFGLGSAVRVRELVNSGGRIAIVALLSWILIGALGLTAVALIPK